MIYFACFLSNNTNENREHLILVQEPSLSSSLPLSAGRVERYSCALSSIELARPKKLAEQTQTEAEEEEKERKAVLESGPIELCKRPKTTCADLTCGTTLVVDLSLAFR